MGKLTLERRDDGDLIIHKAKGKLTVQEIIDFMCEQQQVEFYDGALMTIIFRVRGDREPQFAYEEPAGDSQVLYVAEDRGDCPICGKHDLAIQYCPDCGKKLF